MQAVNAIHLAPGLTFGVKATRFLCDAGVTNSMTDLARVVWDLRSQENAPMTELKEKVTQAIQHSVAALIRAAIRDVQGEEGLLDAKTTPGSEDFFYNPVKRPGVKAGFWELGTNLRGCIIPICAST
ncbi:peptidase M20|nr:peptidase M20 [Candidatus Pantoea persica]